MWHLFWQEVLADLYLFWQEVLAWHVALFWQEVLAHHRQLSLLARGCGSANPFGKDFIVCHQTGGSTQWLSRVCQISSGIMNGAATW